MKSNKLNRILIPLDFSETGLLALEHAIFMASLFEATIYLLHVLEEIEFPAYLNQPLFLIQKHAEVEQIITKQINDLAKKIKKENGVKTIIILCRGKVISGIKNAIIKNNINLIIMGTHGLKGFDEYFIGSNAYKTVTISPCPVITIQTHAEKIGFNTIVMPIDNSLHSRQKVDIVIELATHYKAKIHILGLINSNENIDKNKFNIKIESVEKKIKAAGLKYVRKIVKGENLGVVAMDYSNKIKADLITIMTDHESNLTGMFLGGFAKQIVNHSRIPVMSIRHKEGEFESINLKGIGNPFNEI
jgi:nucleotide-binding universal stress UspA family protein